MTSNLIHFVLTKCIDVYDKLADAFEAMAEEEPGTIVPLISAMATLSKVSTRARAFLADVNQTEMEFTT